MAKKIKKAAPTPADIRAAQLQARLRSIDPSTVVVVQSEEKLAGIPIPFALEYLLDLNILPMGVVFHIYGEKDNNKTTFFWELGRLCQAYGGWPELFLTEGKYSSKLINAILGDLRENPMAQRLVHKYKHMQAWQAALLKTIEEQRKSFLEGKKSEGLPPGAYSPLCYGIDSLTGQLLKSTGDKMAAEGSPERGYALEAGSLTKYLKQLAEVCQDMPAIVVAINHQKVAPSEIHGRLDKRTIGGSQIKFQATYEIELRQGPLVREVDPEATHGLFIQGNDITLTSDKNSLGEKRRVVTVPYRWYYEMMPWGQVQRAKFDWDAAATHILYNLHEKDVNLNKIKSQMATFRERMREVIDFRAINSKWFYSPTLGISKNDPVKATEFGRRMLERPEILDGLRNAFGIKRYTTWDPNTECFFKLSKRLQAAIQKTASSTPKPIKKPAAIPPEKPASSTPPKKPAINPVKPVAKPVVAPTKPVVSKPTISKPAASAKPTPVVPKVGILTRPKNQPTGSLTPARTVLKPGSKPGSLQRPK